MICCEVPRTSCPKHGIQQISVPWAENNSRFSSLFEALAINWLKKSNIKAVAQLLNISWYEASGIKERAVRRGMKRRKLESSKNFGIEYLRETAVQMRHPGVSAVLSFFIPGLGHIYNGQIGWGITFFIMAVFSVVLIPWNLTLS